MKRGRSCPQSMGVAHGATAFRVAVGTHELAIDRKAPDTLRASAGDGYGRATTPAPRGTRRAAVSRFGHLRSVATDPEQPDVVVVSPSPDQYSRQIAVARMASCTGVSRASARSGCRDGSAGATHRIAPLLSADAKAGRNRGPRMNVAWTSSNDSGKSSRRMAGSETSSQHLRGLALCAN